MREWGNEGLGSVCVCVAGGDQTHSVPLLSPALGPRVSAPHCCNEGSLLPWCGWGHTQVTVQRQRQQRSCPAAVIITHCQVQGEVPL